MKISQKYDFHEDGRDKADVVNLASDVETKIWDIKI